MACICHNIQRLIIINTDPKSNHGIAKLIEVQKNLKYFEWKDDFDEYIVDDSYLDDPYREIFLALVEKANTLNHFVINFQHIECFNYEFLQILLPELCRLKTLKFFPSYLN